MKYFMRNQLFYCFISLLVFFSGCDGKDSSRREEDRRGRGDHHLCEEAGFSEE